MDEAGKTAAANHPVLTITFDPETGQVQVAGPVGQKGLCYLMLECAKDAVREHSRRQGPGGPGLVLPGVFRPNGLRG